MKQYNTIVKLKLREKFNPYLAPFRRKRAGLECNESSFTIISNNCWGGLVYQYFGLPYSSPTVGLYFFSDDYIRFLKNLKYYLSVDLKFISQEESKYRDVLIERNYPCPIGVLDDVEIVFLHYATEEEAYIKWNRRKERVNLNNLIVKYSEQNLCTYEHLKEFETLPYKRKFVFVHKDYGIGSQIVCNEFKDLGEVKNDTDQFRRHIDLIKLIDGRNYMK